MFSLESDTIKKQAEAEVVPSSSLVEVKVGVGVEVEVEAGVEVGDEVGVEVRVGVGSLRWVVEGKLTSK